MLKKNEVTELNINKDTNKDTNRDTNTQYLFN